MLEALGRLAWRTRPGDRQIATTQIASAFPRLGAQEVAQMARAAFVCFGRNLADALRDDVQVEIAAEDERRLAEALAEGGPRLILTAHLGCWEQLGRWLGRRLGELGVVTANPHNHWVDHWLGRERRKLGLTPFDRRRDVLAAARWLRRGGNLAVLADHRGQVANVTAAWFGRPAPTAVGPARLARRARALLLPVGIARDGNALRVLVGDSFRLGAEDDRAAATRCNEALEALIRRAPGEWTWFHDRYGDDSPRAVQRRRHP